MNGSNLTIATLNIAAASKERAARILETWVEPSSYDVYVFTETSDGAGTELLAQACRDAGWSIHARHPEPKDRGVVVATRVGAVSAVSYPPNEVAPGRSLVLNLEVRPPLQIVAMYVPNRGNEAAKLTRKRTFLDQWRAHLVDVPAPCHRLVIGDLNVVPRGQDPVFLPQFPFEYEWFDALTDEIGGVDVAAFLNDGHEPTWVAHSGEGYTYDHVLADQLLMKRIASFAYDHTTRLDTRISDHSALILELRLDDVQRTHSNEFVVPTQTELF